MSLIYIIGPSTIKKFYLLNDPHIYNWSLLIKKIHLIYWMTFVEIISPS